MQATKRRDQLIRIATKLFARHGFHATTTKLIALYARCNEAILFQHFNTKQNLYKAALAAKLDKADEALQTVLDSAASRGDDLSIFATLISDLCKLHRTDPTLLPLLMFSLLAHDELTLALFQKLRVRIEQSASLNSQGEQESAQAVSLFHPVN